MSKHLYPLAILVLCASSLTAQPSAARVKPFFPRPTAEDAVVVPRPAPTGPASKLPPELQAVRKQLLAGKRIGYRQLQSLADAGDGIGAFKLAERIVKDGNPRLASDALHYFTIAAFEDRGYAVRHMLDLLNDPKAEFRPAHLKSAEAVLQAQAKKGNDKAVDGLIRFYSEGRPFGDRRGELETLLASGAGQKNGDTAFKLAVILLSEQDRTDEQVEQAGRYLAIAQQHGSIGIRAAAANILATLENPPTEEHAEAQP
jgi:hypothetical protein